MTLDRVRLQSNSGNGSLFESVRGNSGGVAFGYNSLPSEYTSPTLTVTDSYIGGNRAMGFLSPEIAVAGQIFQGRGGGMAVYVNESNQGIRIRISDCVFENNSARLFGGGLYILTTSYETVQHIFTIERCQFLDNMGPSGGGGVQMSSLSHGDVDHPHTFIFSDCLFEGNRGQAGGGVYIFAGKPS